MQTARATKTQLHNLWDGQTPRETTRVDEAVERWEPSYTAGGDVKWWLFLKNNLAVLPKPKHTVSTRPRNFTPGYEPQGKCTHTPLYLTVHSSVMHNNHKVERAERSTNWWILNLGYAYNEILFGRHYQYRLQHHQTLKTYQVKEANHRKAHITWLHSNELSRIGK